MHHLLVTNDFPPKVGGIQFYLWELWRRLPHDTFTVLTTPHPEAAVFDRAQPFRVERTRERVLLPTPSLARRIERLADDVGAAAIVLDPAIPLGVLGPSLDRPYALVVHGSELMGRLPVGSQLMGRAVRGARLVVAAGSYPAAETRRVGGETAPTIRVIPPGVDVDRFRPLDDEEKSKARANFGLPADACVVVSVSRLVRRKGMDVLIRAAAHLATSHPDLVVAIAGGGRDEARLRRLARRLGAPVELLGRVHGDQLPELYGLADAFAMLAHDRWGGLEKEGFGIVFVEAAACAVPQVAGRSGGVDDAVVHGETGIVVDRPRDAVAVADAIESLLRDTHHRQRLGARSRDRAVTSFSYDVLARELADALQVLAP